MVLIGIFIANLAMAQPQPITPSIRIEETDGSPSGGPRTLKFPDNNLVDDGNGIFRLVNPPVISSDAPIASSSPGTAGEITWANGFLYICVATNSWQRVAVAAWTTDFNLIFDGEGLEFDGYTLIYSG